MRIIGENVEHEIVMADPVSGSEISILYRMPTTDERQTYISAQFKRVEDNIEDHSYDARVKYGKKIMTGIGEGQVAFEGKDNEGKPEVKQVSSDPESTHYRADWKDLVEQYLPDVLWFLSYRVFEGMSIARVTPNTQRNDEAYDSKN